MSTFSEDRIASFLETYRQAARLFVKSLLPVELKDMAEDVVQGVFMELIHDVAPKVNGDEAIEELPKHQEPLVRTVLRRRTVDLFRREENHLGNVSLEDVSPDSPKMFADDSRVTFEPEMISKLKQKLKSLPSDVAELLHAKFWEPSHSGALKRLAAERGLKDQGALTTKARRELEKLRKDLEKSRKQ